MIDYEDTTKKIFVTTDASDRRTGAVLSFGETWETAHPVVYESYQLNDAKKNYPVHEKELLAIVKALKKWRTSLLGTHFQIFTDHRTLGYFQSQKDMSRRKMRWSMYLADFYYEIIYIRGEDNTTADALSRMPDATPNPMLAACALAHTRSPPSHAAAVLDITADESLLRDIIDGYQDDDFAKQLKKDISARSIQGTREENGLLQYMWVDDSSFQTYHKSVNCSTIWPMIRLVILALTRAMKPYAIHTTGQTSGATLNRHTSHLVPLANATRAVPPNQQALYTLSRYLTPVSKLSCWILWDPFPKREAKTPYSR